MFCAVFRRTRAAWLAAALLASTAGVAEASSGHKVPDLRQDPKQSPATRGATLKIPLTIHLAASEEHPATTMRRLEAALAQANDALRPFQIEVVIQEIRRMPEGFGSITRRRDRRRIAQYAPPDGSIHVFMVDTLELRGGRQGDRSVRGLHWRYRGVLRKLRQREYVVVSGDAPATTLVHEIGHLFGLAHHSGEQNLMCSCRRGPLQLFTGSQGETIRRGARDFLRR